MKRLLPLVAVLVFSLSAHGAAMSATPSQKLKTHPRNIAEANAVIEEIIDHGDSAAPDLIAFLAEQPPAGPEAAQRHWAAKVTAMNLLGELKAQDALEPLKDILENSDSLSAINNSARTIGRIGGGKAFGILEEVYADAEKGLYDQGGERLRAVIAGLGLCGNKKAAALLKAAMENPGNDPMIRIYAAGSLGLLGSKDGLDVATEGLNASDPYVRLAAVRALGLIAAPSAVPALKKLSGANVDYVYRKSARLSIAQIETEQLTNDNKIVYIQHQLVNHPQTTEFVQWGTLRLKQMNTPKSKKALEDLTTDDAPEFEVLRHAAKIRAKTMK